jgi:hypothetical protein
MTPDSLWRDDRRHEVGAGIFVLIEGNKLVRKAEERRAFKRRPSITWGAFAA